MPKRRGRPRLADKAATAILQTRLPDAMHDEVCRVALERDMSVSAIIREAVISYVKNCRLRRAASE